jgi:hypothetical protein
MHLFLLTVSTSVISERSITKSTLFMLSRVTMTSLPSCFSDLCTNSLRCRDTSTCPTIILLGTSRGLTCAMAVPPEEPFLRKPKKPSSASPDTLSEPRRFALSAVDSTRRLTVLSES